MSSDPSSGIELARDQALIYVRNRDYTSLADLIASNSEVAGAYGKRIVDAMFQALSVDKKLFDYGHQLTGDQLKVLAHALKAGAPVGEEGITIHFDYVARIGRDGRMYVGIFPDLNVGAQGKKLTEVGKDLHNVLAAYLGACMLDGDTLPTPKYHGRKTENVRPLKVQLTLADLVFAGN